MGPFYGISKGYQKRGEFKAMKVSLGLVISRLVCYLYWHLKKRQGVKMKEYPGTKRFGKVLFPILLAIVGFFMVFDGSHRYVGAIFVIGGGALLASRIMKMKKAE